MESDYGLFGSVDDDFIQDYSDYFKEDLNFLEEVEVEFPDDIDVSKKRGIGKRKKRKRFERKQPLSLLDHVLSWNLDSLHTTPRFLSSNVPAVFESKQQYFSIIGEVCIEEARASILHSLDRPLSLMKLSLHKNHTNPNDKNCDDRVLLEFHISKGSREFSRPGWAFSLTYRNYLPNEAEVKLTAVVAQGQRAIKLVGHDVLPLWVSSESLKRALLVFSTRVSPRSNRNNDELFEPAYVDYFNLVPMQRDSLWNAEPLVNLIAFQRMSFACSENLSPPFMHKMLGYSDLVHSTVYVNLNYLTLESCLFKTPC